MPLKLEVIVVDDASTDGSINWIQSEYPDILVISLQENVGFCKAANAGIEASHGEFVQLLNNDTEVTAGWVEAGLAPFADPEVGAVAPLTLVRSDPERVDSAGDSCTFYGRPSKRGHWDRASYWESRGVEEVFGASASSAFYRGTLLRSLGGFDPEYGSYYEDVDLAYRIRRAGFRCRYQPSCRVLHDLSSTYDHGSPALHRRMSRNSEYLFWANHSIKSVALALLPRSGFLLAQLLWRIRQGRARSYLLGKLDAATDWRKIMAKRETVHRGRVRESPAPNQMITSG